VPPVVVTVTLTVPVPAGLLAVMEVGLLTMKAAAATPPNVTDVVPVKLVPVMATAVPPEVGPEVGVMEVMVGAAM